MSLANKILKILCEKPLTINQLDKKIDMPVQTIYGRISELKTRKLIKKINGKFVITELGNEYINKYIKIEAMKNFSHNVEWNYIINNKVKIYAINEQQAHKLAKLIYGSSTEINQIE